MRSEPFEREQPDDAGTADDSGVAIVGMELRLPGAEGVEQFWQNLCQGVESISTFTDEELRATGVGEADLGNPAYVKANAVLGDIESFDASFFGFNPREAEIMDPQHRLFLECAWAALEGAGYDAESYAGRIGVYAGAGFNTYLFNLFSNPDFIARVGYFQTMMQNSSDHLTTLVSYKLNLRGPSVTVQTACSTSLVAVHLACQSLLNGESDMALAGGVSLTIPQQIGYLYMEGGIVSPDGHCRPFDERARGTVGASGVAVVLLKRLADALADGDHVHAVIRGTAVNNDGSAKVGYTAPSIEGQTEVIAEALAMAGVEADDICYVEAHGTATPLGDPIEMAALNRAFRLSTQRKHYCAVGSVKGNIGHADTAAGVAGLIKAALVLKRGQIPPSLHFERPNPAIDFSDSPFFVNTALRELPGASGDAPRAAGVSSFGLGGTNAHAVLVEPPPVGARAASKRRRHLLLLSAKTATALESATARLAGHIRRHPEQPLADIAHTLLVGRRGFGHRRALVCRDREDACRALEGLDPKRVFTGFQETDDRPVVFMFPGGGTQYVNMGRELYETERVFREEVDRCAALLAPVIGHDIRHALYPAAAEQRGETDNSLVAPETALPILFTVEYALARLLMSYGLRPGAMIGHSLGEYVAACLSGVFSLEDALACVAYRARLIGEQPAGAMLAVQMSEDEARRFVNDDISVAAVNGQTLCVLSGATARIAALERALQDDGVEFNRLHITMAAHSHLMEAAMKPLEEFVGGLKLSPPSIPFISNVTGTWMTAEDAADPAYWAKHLRQTVRFADGVGELLKQTDAIPVEVGPGRTLSTLVRQRADRAAWQVVVSTLRHPQEETSDVEFFLNTLGRLWLAGVRLNREHFYEGEQRRRVTLPTYPFERRRYWVEPRAAAATPRAPETGLRKKTDIGDWFYLPSWKPSLAPKPAGRGELAGADGDWLVLSDDAGIGARLAAFLRDEGRRVAVVHAATHFAAPGGDEYSINPREPEHYDRLVQELVARGRAPRQIVHLWSLSPGAAGATGTEDETKAEGETGAEFFGACQERGYYSLLYLAHAFARNELSHELRLTLVANGLQEFPDGRAWWPEKATALSPCLVIPQEFLNISCQSVDVVYPSTGAETERLVVQVVSEIARQSSEPSVAYRGARRFVRDYEATRLEADAKPVREFRRGGVYLITGGRGHVGLRLAESLARTHQARLALLGRSPFPPRAEWDAWLAAHGEDDDVSLSIRRLRGLEEAGSETLLLTADVSDEAQMRDALRQIDERFGELHGVVHAAGITSGTSTSRPVTDIGRGDSETQFVPKVYGLYVLEKILRGRELDFCLCFSSNASILGGMGFVAYAAANMFVDGFAARQNALGAPWISATWDGWGEKAGDAPDEVKTSMDEFIMTSGESTEALRRVVTQASVGQVVVSTGDLRTRLDVYVNRAFLRRQANDSTAETAHARPALANDFAAPASEAERKIASIWQSLLGIAEVGRHDNFFELGGHSLLATQVVSRLFETFGVALTLRALFEKPTVAELALAIEETALAELDEMSEEEAQRLLEASVEGAREG